MSAGSAQGSHGKPVGVSADYGEPVAVSDGSGQPRRSEAHSWFWIALISFVNICYSVSVAPEFYIKVTGLLNCSSLLKGLGFIFAALGILPVPLLFKRIGVFDSTGRFVRAFTLLSALGAASFILFTVLGAMTGPGGVWLLLVLQFISIIIPAITAGCAMHRAVQVVSSKQAALLSGLSVVITFALAAAHMMFILLIGVMNSDTELTRVNQYGKGVSLAVEEVSNIGWRQYAISFVVLYCLMLIIPVVLLLIKKDIFEYTAPKDDVYFPEPMHRKFMALAILMVLLDAFHNSSYYNGGDYGGYGAPLALALMFLPAVFTCGIIVLLNKNKWMPIMLICVLLLCFQQGLNMFFNDNRQLAIAYEFADTLSGSGAPVFLLFIPLIYCVQRRSNASVAMGVVSLWFLANAAAVFVTQSPESNISAIAAPAVTFTLSIASFAYLFYLNGEHNRSYFRALIEEYRSRLKSEELSTAQAITEAGLSEEERKVALLLIEGETRRDISRKLSLSSADVNSRITAVRDKLVRLDDPDPVVASAADEYKLTRREITVLRCLRRGMTNPQIAEELFLSEGTVKVHVHNLLGKLGVDTRQQIPAWAETYGGLKRE